MKKFIACVLAIVISFSISGCGELENDSSTLMTEEARCLHEWVNATCDTPVTCKLCGEIAGEPLGHRWIDATCESPKICTGCSAIDGEPLGHDWADATCEIAKTCKRCGATGGDPLGHRWKDATYDSPKTCSICGKTEGSALFRPATPPETAKTEKRCLICNHLVQRKDTNYCPSHDCQKTGCPYPAKKVQPSSYGMRCEWHSCADPNCTMEPASYSRYCSVHTPK